jgi:hypothetical protein
VELSDGRGAKTNDAKTNEGVRSLRPLRTDEGLVGKTDGVVCVDKTDERM